MPRAGLTPSRVVAEGADLADEVGLDRLTLAAVASRLGVRLPSLYKHVAGLDALRQGLAVQALHELAQALSAATVGRSRYDALAPMAAAYRDYARAHPGRYAATLRAPDPTADAHAEAARAVLTIVLSVLAGYGLTGDRAIDATRALRSALHGFVSLEAGGGFALDRDAAESFTAMVADLDRAFSATPELAGEH
ncbi:MAG TPA: WHG domain-containing protein [Actinomycetes bacterium]|nr:WHG domain-containing protein [Actinomycetes bacterium]